MIRTLAFTAAILAVPALAHANQWDVDPSHSSASFTVKHLMVSNVRGEFGKLKGSATWEKPDFSDAKVEVTVDATTIDTRDAKRDAHLKSPDFFDVAKFPKMTFKSTKVEKAGEVWKLHGDLTLHGVTKPVVLDVTNVTPPTKDPGGNIRIGAQATTKINRQDFGIVFNKTLDGGGVLVGDEISITIDVEVIKKGA